MIATQDDVRAALLGVAADGSWALSAEDTVLIERLIVLRALIFDSNTSELAAELYTEDGNPCPPPLPASRPGPAGWPCWPCLALALEPDDPSADKRLLRASPTPLCLCSCAQPDGRPGCDPRWLRFPGSCPCRRQVPASKPTSRAQASQAWGRFLFLSSTKRSAFNPALCGPGDESGCEAGGGP